MVLTQRELLIRTLTCTDMFPYHYGSHATDARLHKTACLHEFPYHYGSHATESHNLFQINQLFSFHTTMVLTQPDPDEEHPALDILFPYHYGSYATSSSDPYDGDEE